MRMGVVAQRSLARYELRLSCERTAGGRAGPLATAPAVGRKWKCTLAARARQLQSSASSVLAPAINDNPETGTETRDADEK